jgi:uncharacterized membrane protein
MKKGTVFIIFGGIAFMFVGFMFATGGGFGIILGLIFLGVGVVMEIGAWQDYQRTQKQERIMKWVDK